MEFALSLPSVLTLWSILGRVDKNMKSYKGAQVSKDDIFRAFSAILDFNVPELFINPAKPYKAQKTSHNLLVRNEFGELSFMSQADLSAFAVKFVFLRENYDKNHEIRNENVQALAEKFEKSSGNQLVDGLVGEIKRISDTASVEHLAVSKRLSKTINATQEPFSPDKIKPELRKSLLSKSPLKSVKETKTESGEETGNIMMIREVAKKRASKIVMATEDEYDPNKKWEVKPEMGGVIKESHYALVKDED